MRKLICLLVAVALPSLAIAAPVVSVGAYPPLGRRYSEFPGHAPWQGPVQGQAGLTAMLMAFTCIDESAEAPYMAYLKSVTIRGDGTADETRDIANLRLEIDGAEFISATKLGESALETPVFTEDDGTVTFENLIVPIQVAPAEGQVRPVRLKILYDVAEDAQIGGTLHFNVVEAGSFVIKTEDGEIIPVDLLDVPITVAAAPIYPVALPSLQTSVGTLNPSPVLEVAPGATDVVLGEMNFAAHESDITLSYLGVASEGTLSEVNHLRNVRLYRDVNENGLFDASDEQIGETSQVSHFWDGMQFGYTADDGIAMFEGLDHTFAAGASETWLVVCDVAINSPVGETFSLDPAISKYDPADPVLASIGAIEYIYYGPSEWPVITVTSAAKEPTAIADAAPERFELIGAAPNPFNPATTIRYGLTETGMVNVAVFNTAGQRVRTLADGTQSAGWQELVWDGRDSFGQSAASGVYLYRIVSNEGMLVGRMTLVR